MHMNKKKNLEVYITKIYKYMVAINLDMSQIDCKFATMYFYL